MKEYEANKEVWDKCIAPTPYSLKDSNDDAGGASGGDGEGGGGDSGLAHPASFYD